MSKTYSIAGLSAQIWPHETTDQSAIKDFYGAACDTSSFIEVTIPWSANARTATVHKKVAASVTRILNAAWAYVGQDQSKIDVCHLNQFDGSYNCRANKNDPSRKSMHSWGIALDWAAEWNTNGAHWTGTASQLPRWWIDMWLAEGWTWGGDFSGTPDPMHFQATFNVHADSPADGPGSPPGSVVDGMPPLSPGDTGIAVGVIQAILGVPQTEKMDDVTVAAVKAYQEAHNLQVDGEVGPKTWASLAGVSPGSPVPTPPAAVHSGKGSWYSQYPVSAGSKYGWTDTGDKPESNALGVPDYCQGCAFYNSSTLGKWIRLTAPNGVTALAQQTDVGPNPNTGRTIDVAAVMGEMLGYSPSNFPTNSVFSWTFIDPPAVVAGLSPQQQAIQFHAYRKGQPMPDTTTTPTPVPTQTPVPQPVDFIALIKQILDSPLGQQILTLLLQMALSAITKQPVVLPTLPSLPTQGLPIPVPITPQASTPSPAVNLDGIVEIIKLVNTIISGIGKKTS